MKSAHRVSAGRFAAWAAMGLALALSACALRVPVESSVDDPSVAEAPDDDETPAPDTAPDTPPDHALQASAWAMATQVDGTPPAWVHQRFGKRRPTRYTPQPHEGRPAVHALSEAGNSTLRLPLAPVRDVSAMRLAFSWFVPALNEAADLRDDDIDDAVVRVVLTFDGDRSRLSTRDHLLSELSQLITGLPLPYATLMYVWDNRYPVGTVIPNPHTQRIRQLVIESGPDGLNRWRDHERDIEADFRAAFGEAPGRLTALGVMTDANNTGQTVNAWYGPVSLRPALAAQR